MGSRAVCKNIRRMGAICLKPDGKATYDQKLAAAHRPRPAQRRKRYCHALITHRHRSRLQGGRRLARRAAGTARPHAQPIRPAAVQVGPATGAKRSHCGRTAAPNRRDGRPFASQCGETVKPRAARCSPLGRQRPGCPHGSPPHYGGSRLGLSPFRQAWTRPGGLAARPTAPR
jgi:hypothetical protein